MFTVLLDAAYCALSLVLEPDPQKTLEGGAGVEVYQVECIEFLIVSSYLLAREVVGVQLSPYWGPMEG